MPIYTNDNCNEAIPFGVPLYSSLGVNPKITKAIDAATKDWLDEHPDATISIEDYSISNKKLANDSVNARTIEDNSIGNGKLADDSVNARVVADGCITTDKIADLAITTQKIADDSVTSQKIASSAANGLQLMSESQVGVAKVGAGLAMNGQMLELDGSGDIATAVTAWLDAHPEATTTVEDDSITDAKLVQTGGILSKVNDMSGAVSPSTTDITDRMTIPGTMNDDGIFVHGTTDVNYYVLSPFIRVLTGSVIKLTNMRQGATRMCLAFYTSDDESTFVEGVTGNGAGTNKSAIYTCTQDGYIRFTTRTALIESEGTSVVLTNYLGTIETRLDTCESMLGVCEDKFNRDICMIKYVSSNGDDSNNGDTSSTPYATIAKAIDEKADVIVLAAGSYTETVYRSTSKPIRIIGYGATFEIEDASSDCLHIRNCNDVAIYGVTVNFSGVATGNYAGIFIRNGAGRLVDCTVNDAPYMGFSLDGSKVVLERCKATGASIDGFNAHDTTAGISEGTFIDCVATGCGDDGLSFHENGRIHVIGGEYADNVSTGIAPHNNCNCEIRNAYVHGNGAGIEALVGSYDTPSPLPTMVLVGCIFESNVGNAVTAEHYIVKACANGAGSNGTDGIVNSGGSTITTFGLIS